MQNLRFEEFLSKIPTHFFTNFHVTLIKGRGGQEVRGRSCNVTMATPDTRDQS